MAEGSFAEVTLRVFRGDKDGGEPADYRVPLVPGMVVLDALHWIQAHQAPDLAVRWNCKAGKCGSCSAEVNGRPRLTCKTRMDSLPLDQPIDIFPMKSFPVIKDLVVDRSAFDRIIAAAGYISVPTGSAPDGNTILVPKENADRAMDAAACIGCGACVAACPNASAALFTGAKIAHLGLDRKSVV